MVGVGWGAVEVLGLRPDIYIIDDRTRLDDNLGQVWDVFDKFLGNERLEQGARDAGVRG